MKQIGYLKGAYLFLRSASFAKSYQLILFGIKSNIIDIIPKEIDIVLYLQYNNLDMIETEVF